MDEKVIIEFAKWITGHDEETIIQMYDDWASSPARQAIQVQAGVKPACGHKLTAKQFFIKQYQEGKCEDITTNPEPEFNNNFYLNIYKLMEDYSKSV